MSTPDDGAPAETPRPVQASRIAGAHGHRTVRIAVAVASAVTVVATLGSTVAWAGLQGINDNIDKQEIQAGTNRPTKPAPTDPTEYEPLNILVMGTDTRTGQGDDFGNPGTTASGNGHSDTTILLHVSADRSRALAVSIPRDSWVTRPSCKDGDTSTVTGRFNEAFSAGGPSCTIRAVEALTDVRIDHFVVVDFKGFQAVVDSVGGVPICLAEAVDDPLSGLKLDAGTHVLDGTQALAFARARKTLGDGSDLSRIDRQQVFLSALIRQVQSKSLLTDAGTLYSVLVSVSESLTVDTGLGTVDDLTGLAVSMQGLTPSKVKFVTVPWVARSDGATIEWNDAKADPIWQSMINDTAYPPGASKLDGAVLTTAPSAVRVKVLNGSGVDGQARVAAEQLAAQGFVVVGVATAPKILDVTTVDYDPKYDESARTLAFAAKAGERTATGSGNVLTLTIGKDWTGTQTVVIKSSGSGSPSSGVTAKPADENVCVS
ncbi:LCP family protein [Longivirga aurantiaca]|uniref:LCP family protein n=1 Tax=Longivirga aurantiaca TaxID=1837743 RepID=A0ABW1SXX2_9ACTN